MTLTATSAQVRKLSVIALSGIVRRPIPSTCQVLAISLSVIALSGIVRRNAQTVPVLWQISLSVIALSGIVRRFEFWEHNLTPNNFQSSRFQES